MADHERVFRATNAPVDGRTYALQRRVFEHVTRAASLDPLFVEEASLAILARVVEAAPRDRASDVTRLSARTAEVHAELAHDAKQLVGRDPSSRASLSSIAGALGVSPFHLARVFRVHAGLGVHAYRTQLRLRTSLERVAGGEDLTRVALDLGFSSHGHFTTAFARAFGEAPSAFRASASSSKILEAGRAFDRTR